MRAFMADVDLAPSEAHLVIIGEIGTGARYIHENSTEPSSRSIAARWSTAWSEPELFGYDNEFGLGRNRPDAGED